MLAWLLFTPIPELKKLLALVIYSTTHILICVLESEEWNELKRSKQKRVIWINYLLKCLCLSIENVSKQKSKLLCLFRIVCKRIQMRFNSIWSVLNNLCFVYCVYIIRASCDVAVQSLYRDDGFMHDQTLFCTYYTPQQYYVERNLSKTHSKHHTTPKLSIMNS
jgi:hypothetical protein